MSTQTETIIWHDAEVEHPKEEGRCLVDICRVNKDGTRDRRSRWRSIRTTYFNSLGEFHGDYSFPIFVIAWADLPKGWEEQK
jgi:hypothetical protein